MKKAYAEKRFFEWHEDELAVSLRAKSGSYGGGSEVLVLESNQNHARAENTEVCPCLPASMGLGGGYVPMIVSYGFDSYNQTIETETAQPLRSHGGGDTTPKVVVMVLASIAPNAERTDGSISPTIMHRAGTGGAIAYLNLARGRR